MGNRFRIEIYDDVKSNDITIFSDQGADREYLSELIFSNMLKFQGNIKAYVYDSVKKKKTAAAYLPMDIASVIKSKTLA